MSFRIASSPHGHNQRNTSEMMRWVCYALVPGVLLHSYFFGSGIWFQILLAVVTAIAAEMACTVARERPAFSALRDNTAIVTAVLLAISIPSLAALVDHRYRDVIRHCRGQTCLWWHGAKLI